MKVITLGTGAGRPSPLRSASAVGLEYEGETFLFDCGEGTQLQCMRSSFKWGRMGVVMIGHLHGDHVNGLPGLLGTLSLSDRSEPMVVYGPKGIKKFFRAFQETQRLGLRFPMEMIEISEPGTLLETDTYKIETLPLSHSITCWGYRFQEKDRPGRFDQEKATQLGIPEGPERGKLVRGESVQLADGRLIDPKELVGPSRPGRSVVYCLDTRPCKRAVELSREASLLLYEATFESQLEKEAHDYGHSTALDGARIAQQARAKRLVLTHISPRYNHGETLKREAQRVFPNVELAKDLDIFEVED